MEKMSSRSPERSSRLPEKASRYPELTFRHKEGPSRYPELTPRQEERLSRKEEEASRRPEWYSRLAGSLYLTAGWYISVAALILPKRFGFHGAARTRISYQKQGWMTALWYQMGKDSEGWKEAQESRRAGGLVVGIITTIGL